MTPRSITYHRVYIMLIRISSLALCLLLLACSNDGGRGPTLGAGGSIDAGAAAMEASDTDTTTAGSTTRCGPETCQRATEICVSGSFGGPSSIGCRSVPPRCVNDRSCSCVAATYCNVGLAICTEPGDNHIDCETGLD